MFCEIEPADLEMRPFARIGGDWMLLTAEKPDGSVNCMTASWGGVGVLWGKPVLYCFIRPQRYTHQFSEEGNRLSACFFPAAYHKVLSFCGKVSGRDTDKIRESGLTLFRTAAGVYYKEADLVFLGRKLYADRLHSACFTEPAVAEKNYAAGDYHTAYVYEIEKILQKTS